MDWLDLLILGLRLALVAVLYGFLLVVLRVATRGLRASPAPSASSAARALYLSVLDAGGSSLAPGEAIELTSGALLGRTGQVEILVDDPAVSSEHARISRVGGDWVVTDLGSTNGTRVNEALIEAPTALAAGDILGLGNARLRVVAR